MGFKGRVIGLTGNISCGKSTVARFLTDLGVPVIDADQVAREVAGPGSPTLQQITEAFGPDALDAHGKLDRKKLRETVFGDETARRRLEAIMHPAIRAHSQKLIQAQFEAGKSTVLYEASLLIETGGHRDLDGLLLVTCPMATQKKRLMERDEGTTAELADQMIASQMSQEEKTRFASWTIVNDGSLEELRAKTETWFLTHVGKNRPA